MLDTKTNIYLKSQPDLKYTFEGVDKFELAKRLITVVGVKDPEYRDGIYLNTMAHLIHDKHFSNEQLSHILEQYISEEYLQCDLDNEDEYSVLKRAYSLLHIATLLYVHVRDNVFSNDLIQKTYGSLIYYYEKESIYKGYDDELGWIHTIAHSADAFTQLLRCKELTEKQMRAVLNLISDKFIEYDHTFIADEDVRTTNAIYEALKRNQLSETYIKGWINKLAKFQKGKTFPSAYTVYINVKALLQSIYFKTVDISEYEFISSLIKNVLKEDVTPWNRI